MRVVPGTHEGRGAVCAEHGLAPGVALAQRVQHDDSGDRYHVPTAQRACIGSVRRPAGSISAWTSGGTDKPLYVLGDFNFDWLHLAKP